MGSNLYSLAWTGWNNGRTGNLVADYRLIEFIELLEFVGLLGFGELFSTPLKPPCHLPSYRQTGASRLERICCGLG
ncbi:MAG: hypothetical protein AB1638_10825 [Nitrospirota bacterium]